VPADERKAEPKTRRVQGPGAEAVIEDVLGHEMPSVVLKLQPSPHRHGDVLPQFVGIEELAARLGVSVRHVRRLVSERRIPFHKWGRLLRLDIGEVVDWLDATRNAPADDEVWR
jgi:excisionase family DNA binding protein